jgi:hypothetical protein
MEPDDMIERPASSQNIRRERVCKTPVRPFESVERPAVFKSLVERPAAGDENEDIERGAARLETRDGARLGARRLSGGFLGRFWVMAAASTTGLRQSHAGFARRGFRGRITRVRAMGRPGL